MQNVRLTYMHVYAILPMASYIYSTLSSTSYNHYSDQKLQGNTLQLMHKYFTRFYCSENQKCPN